MAISKKKLRGLYEYLTAGGSSEIEDVALHLGLDPESDTELLKEYEDALKQEYPDLFSDDGEEDSEDEEPAPKVFKLLGEDKVLRELEVVKEKGDTLILSLVEPKELVKIMLRGQAVTVDLLKLRANPSGTTFNTSNERLILLAEAAQL